MPVLCEDSPLKKCGNYVIDTEASPIECCVDTPYNPTSQGCCNGVVYGTNSFDCCGGIVFDMYSGSECCGDAIDGNIFLRSEAEAIYGAEAPVGDSVDSGVCCGTHRVPSSDYCCGDDIITMAASAENSAATVPLSSREKISVPVVVSWESRIILVARTTKPVPVSLSPERVRAATQSPIWMKSFVFPTATCKATILKDIRCPLANPSARAIL